MAKPRSELHSVQLFGDVDAALEEYLRKHDKKKRDTVNRLITRFLAQPDAVKTALLNGADVGMEVEYAKALEGMADELRARYHERVGVKRAGKRRGGAGNGSSHQDQPQHQT